jgi:hypothetical protein
MSSTFLPCYKTIEHEDGVKLHVPWVLADVGLQ